MGVKDGTHRGQRTTGGTQSSPTVWAPELGLRSLDLAARALTLPAILLSLKTLGIKTTRAFVESLELLKSFRTQDEN